MSGMHSQSRGEVHKAYVYAAVAHPLLDIIVVAVEELELNMRIVTLKFLQHPRQPVDGDGGKGPDADKAAVKPAYRRRHLAELLGAV